MASFYETGIRDDIKVTEKKTVLRKTNVFERAAIAEQKFSETASKLFLIGGAVAGATWLYSFLKASHVPVKDDGATVEPERARDE